MPIFETFSVYTENDSNVLFSRFYNCSRLNLTLVATNNRNTHTKQNMKEKISEISIDEIIVNPFQPRKHFNEESLNELIESIKSIGILQPPIVRPLKSSSGYELIAGERRVRAAEKAGLKKLSVIIRESECSYSAEAALIENIQRVDLNPIEIATAVKKLMSQFNMTQEQVARKVGKKRSTIANYLRILSLPEQIQSSIAEGSLSVGHAKVILSFESQEQQLLIYEKIQSGQLSVRASEQLVKQFSKAPLNVKSVSRNDHIDDLTEQMQHVFGTKVNIKTTGPNTGQICISYFSLDDLDRILEIMNVVKN